MLTLAALATVFATGRTVGDLAAGREVRVLFYGQSITEQGWTRTVEEDLRRRYPKARLVVENRAIGGFAADKLQRTLRSDVQSFWPDLVIFHDYGGEPDYEGMIRWLRTRTSAELLLQSDHVTWLPDPAKPDPDRARGEAWHDAHATWLRELALRTGAGFVDVRGAWRAELARTGEAADAYLTDGVHLNERGEALMARLVAPAIGPGPLGAPRPTVAKGAEFDGVRVDVRLPKGAKAYRARVDGLAPSRIADLWIHRRSTGAGRIPLLKAAGFETLPVAETWTLTLSEVSEDGAKFRFALAGSVTGPDGEGSSDAPFRSRSGRVLIEPRDWEGSYVKWLLKEGFGEGFRATFETQLTGSDEVPGDGAWHTVAQGLAPGAHRLEGWPKGAEVRAWGPGWRG